MDKLLETIASQVPSLIVLAIIVRWFLSHLESRDEFIKALHTEHMKAREESRDALRDATRTMEEVRAAIRNESR